MVGIPNARQSLRLIVPVDGFLGATPNFSIHDCLVWTEGFANLQWRHGVGLYCMLVDLVF
jgi:hypothetical protein